MLMFQLLAGSDYFSINDMLSLKSNLPSLLTLIRTVLLRNLTRTYIDNCQHAIFLCFSMLMRTVFKVYMLPSYSRYARLINLTTRSIDCTVNLILIKHCNLESKIQGLLPTQGIILACLALS